MTSAAGLKPGRRHGSAYMLIYHSKDSLDFTGEEPKVFGRGVFILILFLFLLTLFIVVIYYLVVS